MKRMTHNDILDIIDNSGKETAEKWISNHPEIEAANKLARIEKAAPELLKACRGLLDMITDNRLHGPEVFFAAAAIAAAEGREESWKKY